MLSVGCTGAKHACCWSYILLVAVNGRAVHQTAEQVVEWIIMGQGYTHNSTVNTLCVHHRSDFSAASSLAH